MVQLSPAAAGIERHRLHLEQPEAETQVHRRAAQWLTNHGDPSKLSVTWCWAGIPQRSGGALLMGPRDVIAYPASPNPTDNIVCNPGGVD